MIFNDNFKKNGITLNLKVVPATFLLFVWQVQRRALVKQAFTSKALFVLDIIKF